MAEQSEVAPPLCRTQLSEDTRTALFILDALAPMTDEAMETAAVDLKTLLTRLGPDVQTRRVLIASSTREGD